MGKTYRGSIRKEFGSQKARNHKSRSKWTAQNGTRLRSLNADILEFQAHEASSGISLHRSPDHSNRGEELAETIRQLKESKPKPVVTMLTPRNKPKRLKEPKPSLTTISTPKKIRQFDIYEAMPTVVLEGRKTHASRQISHLTKVIGTLRKEFSYSDSGVLAALKRYEERRVFWNREAGTIGPILSARKASS